MRRVAALYVDTAAGPYADLDGVDCYGFASKDGRQHDLFAPTRDANAYAGPWPVVAHPPCGPWGRFRRRYLGREGGAEAAVYALRSVQRYGGVLEHPAGSMLWDFGDLPKPGDPPDEQGGITLAVEQVRWGHPCMKPTWLYCVRLTLPPLPPRREPTHCMVRLKRNPHSLPELPKKERHITPPDLAEWLVRAAQTAS